MGATQPPPVGTGVAVGGKGVAVAGTVVGVGGTSVDVGGAGVAVGGTGVGVGGTGVAVGGGGTQRVRVLKATRFADGRLVGGRCLRRLVVVERGGHALVRVAQHARHGLSSAIDERDRA